MKALGIVRKIDDLGRVVIPKEVRNSQEWKTGQSMEMFMDGDCLVLKPYNRERDKEIVLEDLKEKRKLAGLYSEGIESSIEKAINFIEKGEV